MRTCGLHTKMYTTYTNYPLCFLGFAGIFFHLAIRRQPGPQRQLLAFGHIANLLMALSGGRAHSIPWYPMMVPMIFGLSLHTSSILVLEKYRIEDVSSEFLVQIRTTYRILGDARRQVMIKTNDGSHVAETQRPYHRLKFALLRCCRILLIWFTYRMSIKSFQIAIVKFNITIDDFAPDNQSIIPTLRTGSLVLRVMMSTYWIWETYASLTGIHDILALCFVLFLRWDSPDEWRDLFGWITEAHSLRRFWGLFWHRLHVSPFEALMPRSAKDFVAPFVPLQAFSTNIRAPTANSLRAFWIFLMSAVCHVAVNWIMTGKANIVKEIRFFLLNYTLCTTEALVARKFRVCAGRVPKLFVHLGGYIWVFTVFFCLAPAWQYPSVYDLADSPI
jgi:hypothetical protein